MKLFKLFAMVVALGALMISVSAYAEESPTQPPATTTKGRQFDLSDKGIVAMIERTASMTMEERKRCDDLVVSISDALEKENPELTEEESLLRAINQVLYQSPSIECAEATLVGFVQAMEETLMLLGLLDELEADAGREIRQEVDQMKAKILDPELNSGPQKQDAPAQGASNAR